MARNGLSVRQRLLRSRRKISGKVTKIVVILHGLKGQSYRLKRKLLSLDFSQPRKT